MPTQPSTKSDFSPPSAEQLQEHLLAFGPTPPSPLVALAPLLIMGAAFMLLLMPQGPLAYLALILVAGLMIWTVNRMRVQRHLGANVARLGELATLRYWPQALAEAWQLLPRVSKLPELHARTVAAMAHCLDQVCAYESSILAYDHLIERVPSEHQGAIQLKLHRTMAQLASDHLADADDSLRQLRKITAVAQPQVPNVLSATYRLAYLIQQVRTRHWDDAVAQADGLVKDLRPLGVEAGYGYALMSLSYQELPLEIDEQFNVDPDRPLSDPKQVATWWSRATLLLPPGELIRRFKELSPLTTEAKVMAATCTSEPPQAPKAPCFAGPNL